MDSKLKSKEICSRWNVSYEEMSREQLIYLLKNNRGVVKNKAKQYYARHYWLDYNEIYSVAFEGFYKAILAYKPEKGNLLNYAECYCQGWIKTYFDSRKPDRREVQLVHNNYEKLNAIPYDDVLFLKQVKEILNSDEIEILEHYSYRIKIKDSMKYFGFDTRHQYAKLLQNTLSKVRAFARS